LLLQERLLGRVPRICPVSEALPGNQSLVHLSVGNRTERETAASVFPVAGSWIGGYCNLAKGWLVLPPILSPFCLHVAFCYVLTHSWRIPAFAREDTP